MASYKDKVKQLQAILGEDIIDLHQLKNFCYRSGVPDEPGFRSLAWKLLLDYLPPEHSTWKCLLEKKRQLYHQFIEEMVVTPLGCQLPESNRIDVTLADHPLNPNPESKWQTFFKDNEVLSQIDKDVRRLCPDISFFQQATDFPCQAIVSEGNGEGKRLHQRVQHTALSASNVQRKGLGISKLLACTRKQAAEDYVPLPPGHEAHWEVIERILFIYAKLNPGQSYVQGMNEIIGPIYYVFASDPDPIWREHAEADCFFCFTQLMSEIRDFFIKTLDESETGINGMMDKLMGRLKECEPQVWNRLRQQELEPQFFSFRWITLLLSQEFNLPEILRIWDSLFGDTHRFDFLLYVCCAMMTLIKDRLLNGDFPHNLKLLQNFPIMDVHIILDCANQLRLASKST